MASSRYRRGWLRLSEGRIQEVLPTIHPLPEVALGENWPYSPQLAYRVLTMAGVAKMQAGHLESAEHFLLKALSRTQEIYGSVHPGAIRPLMYLADVYVRSKRWDDAESRLEQAFQIQRNKANFVQAGIIGSLLVRRALLSYGRGDFETSEKRYLEALAFHRANPDTNPDGVVAAYNTLGAIAVQSNRLDVGARYFEQVVETLQSGNPTYPLLEAEAWNNLGVVRLREGKFEESLRSYGEALTIRLKAVGEVSTTVAMNLTDMGHVNMKLGRLEAAEHLYLRSLKAFEQIEPSLQAADAYRGHAVLLARTGRPQAAEEAFQKSLEMLAGLPAHEPPLLSLTLENYASFLREQGRDAEADEVTAKIPKAASE